MTRSDQIHDRRRIELFFRILLAGEAQVRPADRDRLAERLARPINMMRVYAFPASPAPPTTAAFEAEASPAYTSVPHEPLADMAPWPEPEPEPDPHYTYPQPDLSEPDAPTTFNPYAFNPIVIFRREGPDALLARLQTIASVENLRQLATAQHIGVPRDIDEPAALRIAIVRGTQQRLADRLAAGS